jgi:serine/threonine-protein kinase
MLSAVEVRVLSRLLERARALPRHELEPWIAALPEAQQVLVPRLRERLAQTVENRTATAAAPAPPTPRARPVAATTPNPGPVGGYRLLRELGSPGSSKVWLAVRAEGASRQNVALRLAPERAAAADRMLVTLPEHPRVARLLYAGVDERGRAYRVMPWVEGLDIVDHVQRRRPGQAQRVRLVLQVCEALQLAHAEHVAHGDIRPANLRVDDHGHVTLLDWGQGRLLHAASLHADLLALGTVLQQVLVGVSPGPDLTAVLGRALNADPARNYDSVPSLAEDLRRVVLHRPVPGPHATPAHRVRMLLRRKQWELAGSTLLAALVVATAVVGWRHYATGEAEAGRADQARAFLAQALAGDAQPGATEDPAQHALRLQRVLEQARAGFAGEPVLRGQVLAEIGVRFRDLEQPDQALAVLGEAVALLQATAHASDPALHTARAQWATQLLQSAQPDAAARAAALAHQVLDGCHAADCASARTLARRVLEAAASTPAP